MAKQIINTGTGPNTGTGDTVRAAMQKVVSNFDELYLHVEDLDNPHGVTPIQIGAIPESDLGVVVATLGLDGKLTVSQRPTYAYSDITDKPVGITDSATTGVIDVTDGLVTVDTALSVTGGIQGDLAGNASSADTLSTARDITLSGDVSGSVSFDGSQDVQINVALDDVATSGTYGSATQIPVFNLDAKGRVTSVTPTSIGNATTSTKLLTSRDITLSGDAQGTVGFDGSQDVEIEVTLSDSGVIAGSVGSQTEIPVITVDSKGRITSLSSETISIAGSSDNDPNTLVRRDAGGNFSAGTISADLNGEALSASKLSTERNIELIGDVSGSVDFDGSQNVQLTVSLDDVGTAGTYGTATQIPVLAVDSKGRVTSVTPTSIGNAPTATKLRDPRTISVSGDVSGSVSFDGSANADITVTLDDSGVIADTYGSDAEIPVLTVDSKGRVTQVSTAAITKASVGLDNVQNVDQTNASNLTSGTLDPARLPNSVSVAGTEPMLLERGNSNPISTFMASFGYAPGNFTTAIMYQLITDLDSGVVRTSGHCPITGAETIQDFINYWNANAPEITVVSNDSSRIDIIPTTPNTVYRIWLEGQLVPTSNFLLYPVGEEFATYKVFPKNADTKAINVEVDNPPYVEASGRTDLEGVLQNTARVLRNKTDETILYRAPSVYSSFGESDFNRKLNTFGLFEGDQLEITYFTYDTILDEHIPNGTQSIFTVTNRFTQSFADVIASLTPEWVVMLDDLGRLVFEVVDEQKVHSKFSFTGTVSLGLEIFGNPDDTPFSYPRAVYLNGTQAQIFDRNRNKPLTDVLDEFDVRITEARTNVDRVSAWTLPRPIVIGPTQLNVFGSQAGTSVARYFLADDRVDQPAYVWSLVSPSTVGVLSINSSTGELTAETGWSGLADGTIVTVTVRAVSGVTTANLAISLTKAAGAATNILQNTITLTPAATEASIRAAITQALSYISSPNIPVVIRLPAGNISFASEILLEGISAENVYIVGQDLDRAATSSGSSTVTHTNTGSPNAQGAAMYNVAITNMVESGTGAPIAVGDWVTVVGSIPGASPNVAWPHIFGFHQVVAVSGTTITIRVPYACPVAPGNVPLFGASSITILMRRLNTVLTFASGSNGIRLNNSKLGGLASIGLVGQGAFTESNTSGYNVKCGIYVSNNSDLLINTIGVASFPNRNIFTIGGSRLCSGSWPLGIPGTSAPNRVFLSGSQAGLSASFASTVDFGNMVSIHTGGSTGSGIEMYMGDIILPIDGLSLMNVSIGGTNFNGITAFVGSRICAQNIIYFSIRDLGSGSAGIRADQYSFVNGPGNNTGIVLAPAANTVGNGNSFIRR